MIRFARPRALLLGSLSCWLGFAVMAMLVVTGWTQPLDDAILAALRQDGGAAAVGTAWLTRWMASATLLGDGTVRSALVVAVALALLAVRQGRAAAFLLCAALPAGLLSDGLKVAFARARPDVVAHLAPAGGWSFPSGHAMGAMSAWLAMALAVQAVLPNAGARRAATGVALGIAGLVAFTRVWLGVHYPSDAIGGLLAGAGWVLAVRYACQPLLRA